MAKYVIIGGVAGGATTAARLRRNDEKAEIVMFERGEYISYANCGLPYYIGSVIPERSRLFVQTPEDFRSHLNIDVRISSEVTAVNRKKKTVTVKEVKTGREYEESYDKLVLSPGAEPVRPPIPGIQEEGIFTLRSVPDTDRIKSYIEQQKPRRAVIVGAGFIGLEMAENLHHQGILVTIVEMAEQVMTVLDYEMAAEVHQHLKTRNVEFYLKDGVASFTRNGKRLSVALSSGRSIETDMVILSIGVRPESGLARDAGLEVGKTGGIVVDEYLATKDPDIYALGDAIEFTNPIIGRPLLIPLAGPANKQGRILADNLSYGNRKKFPGALATAIAKVFDLTVATTGVSEKVLKREGIPYRAVITHSSSHAGYYPDAKPMSIKTIFSPEDGKLLGAQIVGYEGVDKRIDLFAAVLRSGGTVSDLGELEHGYAPPYSSAKDPVNIAGFVAENVLTGRSRHVQWYDLLKQDGRDVFLLDVRTPEEHELGSIDGAANINVYDLRERLAEVPRDKPVVTFCGVGLRAYLAERILTQNGFSDVANLSGGYKTWSMVSQKQSNEDIFANDIIWKDDNIYQADPEKHMETAPGVSGKGAGNGSSALQADRPVLRIKTMEVDASGLQCPGPILRLKKEMQNIQEGERIRQTATDPGFARDVQSWCNMTGNRLVELQQTDGKVTAVVEKQTAPESGEADTQRQGAKDATLIVFSDSLDKALASFVIANGAASTGKNVTMFFTFWGLSVIKRNRKPKTRKDLMGRMFGWMLPGSSRNLSLSKMNMGGMGSLMMRGRMKSRQVDSLEEMIRQAREAGVRMVACQMSMDVMGVKAEELLDGVEVGGVASYLESAGKSGVNLFV